jgi:hypothetical protein
LPDLHHSIRRGPTGPPESRLQRLLRLRVDARIPRDCWLAETGRTNPRRQWARVFRAQPSRGWPSLRRGLERSSARRRRLTSSYPYAVPTVRRTLIQNHSRRFHGSPMLPTAPDLRL